MIREHLFEKRLPTDPLFRWRGGAVSRLEGFADGVFAVVVALLIATASVPRSFHELWLTLRDLPVFLVTFLFVLMCWHDHYIYFRRYGLEDGVTKVLNGAFLFLVAFFAFPLKFLATFLWYSILGIDVTSMFAVQSQLSPLPEWLASPHEQRSAMMAFYSLGVLGIYAVLSLMLLRAHQVREELELDVLEVHLTRGALRHQLVMVMVAALSLLLLFFFDKPSWAGMVYFLLGPLHAAVGFSNGAKTAKLSQELAADES